MRDPVKVVIANNEHVPPHGARAVGSDGTAVRPGGCPIPEFPETFFGIWVPFRDERNFSEIWVTFEGSQVSGNPVVSFS